MSESDIDKLPKLARITYKKLIKVDKNKANSVAKYFIDIEKSISKCWSILKPNGMAVFVIGNTEYRGVKIENAKYLSQCMKTIGFKQVTQIERKISMKTLTPYRDSMGRFTKKSGQKEIYAKEFIAIGIKNDI